MTTERRFSLTKVFNAIELRLLFTLIPADCAATPRSSQLF
jgi:hypothetical protein